MNTEDVGTLFAYSRWANARLLDAAARLTTADFIRDLGGSFGSVRGTLVHILSGERRWLQFWLDGSLIAEPDVDAFPHVANLAAAWTDLDREREAFARSLTEDRLAAQISVRGQSYVLRELIQHIANHSTYHRGQVALFAPATRRDTSGDGLPTLSVRDPNGCPTSACSRRRSVNEEPPRLMPRVMPISRTTVDWRRGIRMGRR